MKLTTNNQTYALVSARLSEDGCVLTAAEPVAVGAVLTLTSDDGTVLREYAVADYLRCVVDGCTVRLTNTPEPTPVPVDVEAVRAEVLTALSAAQEAAITAGVDVVTETAGAGHFTLTPNDQANIDNMFNAVLLGADGYLYHADTDDCRYYPAADIITIYTAEQRHITYQTTYGNRLRALARRTDDADALRAITYGQDLPDDLAAELAALLAVAEGEMAKVLNNFTGGNGNDG